MLDELAFQELWVVFERQTGHGGTVAFFDNAYGTFSFRDVFSGGGDVETNVVEFKEGVSQAGEFIVGMGHNKVETSGFVHIVDSLEAGENMFGNRSGGDVFDGDEV